MESLPIESPELDRTCGTTGTDEEAALLRDAPRHEVFYKKDDAPDDEGVFYRERRIVATETLTKPAAAKLATQHLDGLRAVNGHKNDHLFISIGIFDHTFEDLPKRPAIAALTWKSWKGKEPTIIFPLSGDKGITYHENAPKPVADPTAEAVQSRSRRQIAAVSTVKEKRKDPRPKTDPLVEERMILAFEGMQGIFGISDHDEAADFVLRLARDTIPCAAGECLLVSPKRYVLYVSAIAGPLPETRRNTRISMANGIIGFSASSSTVLTINDVTTDERFVEEVDSKGDFDIQSILVSPIQFEGETIGVIELLNSDKEGGFSESDANILSYLASSFAEFASISLPSRQARFTDQDFTVMPTEITATEKAPRRRSRGERHASALKDRKNAKAHVEKTAQDKSSPRKTIKVAPLITRKKVRL